MAPSNLDERRKGEPFPESVAFPTGQRFTQKSGRVLMEISHLGADEKNQPANVHPDKKHDHDCKARIDSGVTGGVGNEHRECGAYELPQDARGGAADERRTEPHIGVRNQLVKESERRAKQDERHDVGRQGKDVTDKSDLDEALHQPITLGRGGKG